MRTQPPHGGDKATMTFSRSATLSEVDYDSKSQKMTYKACPLDGDVLPAAEMNHVVIFVDDFGVGFTPWPPSG